MILNSCYPFFLDLHFDIITTGFKIRSISKIDCEGEKEDVIKKGIITRTK
jgi:hypothetical protein